MARTIVVPPLAMPKYADTEVSTNIAFNADDAHLREFEMRFALEGDGVLGPFGGRAGVALPIRLEHDARHAQSPGVPAEWFSCAVSSHFFYNHAEVRPC